MNPFLELIRRWEQEHNRKATEQDQIAILRANLALWGIHERFDENGNGYYLREDFEHVWKQLGMEDEKP
jgi:hypothetical protein